MYYMLQASLVHPAAAVLHVPGSCHDALGAQLLGTQSNVSAQYHRYYYVHNCMLLYVHRVAGPAAAVLHVPGSSPALSPRFKIMHVLSQEQVDAQRTPATASSSVLQPSGSAQHVLASPSWRLEVLRPH